MNLYSNSLGVAIAQNTYATNACNENVALRQLLARVDLNGFLVQTNASHANRPFPPQRLKSRSLAVTRSGNYGHRRHRSTSR